MTLAQKENETNSAAGPSTSTPSEVQQKLAKLRERQVEQETAETKTATAVQQKVAQLREQQAQQEAAEQRVASLRAEQAEKQAAQQRITALRARVGSGGLWGGEWLCGGSGPAAVVPRVLGAGVVPLEVAEARVLRGLGAQGLAGCRAFVCVPIRQNCRRKFSNAWNIPPQSKGLQAAVFLSINRAGNVEQARLVRGSGNALFDESLQRAIKQAQPLPALPEDYC